METTKQICTKDGTTTIAFTNAPKSYSYAFGLLQGNGDKGFEIELEDGKRKSTTPIRLTA